MEKTYETMTPEQAIREIESGNFYRVDGVKACVIDALKRRIAGLEILEMELRKQSRKEYDNGRLTGLYDGLGIDFFN